MPNTEKEIEIVYLNRQIEDSLQNNFLEHIIPLATETEEPEELPKLNDGKVAIN